MMSSAEVCAARLPHNSYWKPDRGVVSVTVATKHVRKPGEEGSVQRVNRARLFARHSEETVRFAGAPSQRHR
jgi:hypothetical protein